MDLLTRNKRRAGAALALLALAMLLPCVVQAEEAAELTGACTITSNSPMYLFRLTDGLCDRAMQTQFYQENHVDIEAPEGSEIHALYVIWEYRSSPVALERWDEAAGAFTEEKTVNTGECLHDIIRLEKGARKLRLRSTDREGTLRILEMSVWGSGELPEDRVQAWEPPCTDADILFLVAHPDDEYIFLGGAIPWYAQGAEVAVAYMTTENDARAHELLNGLWTCGVRHYPYLLGFDDKLSFDLRRMYGFWGEDKALSAVAELLETTRARVVVTQAVDGEYGHGAHQAVADLCLRLIRGGERRLKSHPDKLYVHLYPENPIRLDWENAVMTVGGWRGATALEAAQAAFACHVSQQGFSQEIKVGEHRGEKFRFEVVGGGIMDNGAFGLAYSAVGPDEAGNDFLEHVTQHTGSGAVPAEKPPEKTVRIRTGS